MRLDLSKIFKYNRDKALVAGKSLSRKEIAEPVIITAQLHPDTERQLGSEFYQKAGLQLFLATTDTWVEDHKEGDVSCGYVLIIEYVRPTFKVEADLAI